MNNDLYIDDGIIGKIVSVKWTDAKGKPCEADGNIIAAYVSSGDLKFIVLISTPGEDHGLFIRAKTNTITAY